MLARTAVCDAFFRLNSKENLSPLCHFIRARFRAAYKEISGIFQGAFLYIGECGALKRKLSSAARHRELSISASYNAFRRACNFSCARLCSAHEKIHPECQLFL